MITLEYLIATVAIGALIWAVNLLIMINIEAHKRGNRHDN